MLEKDGEVRKRSGVRRSRALDVDPDLTIRRNYRHASFLTRGTAQSIVFEDINAARVKKLFEDPRLVYTGRPDEGVALAILGEIWADNGLPPISNRALARILRIQKGPKRYIGDYVIERDENFVVDRKRGRARGVHGWRFNKKENFVDFGKEGRGGGGEEGRREGEEGERRERRRGWGRDRGGESSPIGEEEDEITGSGETEG